MEEGKGMGVFEWPCCVCFQNLPGCCYLSLQLHCLHYVGMPALLRHAALLMLLLTLPSLPPHFCFCRYRTKP